MPTLIEVYRSYAEAHGKYTRGEGPETTNEDPEAMNKVFDALNDTARRLIKTGAGALLFTLFEDSDPWVQYCAASHTLKLDESRAIAKLEEIESAGIPLTSMCARYVLEAWRKGELHLPEDDHPG